MWHKRFEIENKSDNGQRAQCEREKLLLTESLVRGLQEDHETGKQHAHKEQQTLVLCPRGKAGGESGKKAESATFLRIVDGEGEQNQRGEKIKADWNVRLLRSAV